MTDSPNDQTRWLAIGLAIATAVAVVDLSLAGAGIPFGLLVVAPLTTALRAGARPTAIVASYALALAILLGIPDDIFLTLEHLLRALVVVAAGALAVWVAWLRDRAERAEALSRYVADIGTQLDRSLDYSAAVETLSRLLVPIFADWAAVYQLADDGSIKQAAVAHEDPAKREAAADLERRYPFHLDQPIGVPQVIRTGVSELLSDIPDAAIEAIAYDDEHVRLLRRLGFCSALFTPLRARGKTLGVLALATAESRRRLGADELALAEDVADRAALAIDNARLYTQIKDGETRLRRSRDELEAVLQGVASAITVQDPSGKLMYVNEAAAEVLGFPSVDELLATPPGQIMDRFETCGEDRKPLALGDLPGRIAMTGRKPPGTILCFRDKATAVERWSLVKATPILDEDGKTALVVNIFDDITAQKQAELAQRFLSEASALLSSTLDYEATLDNVAHLAIPSFSDWCGVDLVDATGAIRSAAVAHADPSKIAMAEELRNRYPVARNAPQGVPNVIRTGRAEIYPEIPDELLAESAIDDDHLALIRSLQLRSVIIAPMVVRGEAIGALTFVMAESNRRFGERDLELAVEVARRAATAVENARLYTERTHIARTLQTSLLPPMLPRIPGIELAARFRPAGEGYDVGGDFYDVFNTGGAGWAVVIGDVCGKGPEAAALTALARYTLRAAAMQTDDPRRILALLSEAIMRQRSDTQFCTAAYGRLELQDVGARMTVSSGGHPLPLLLTEDGQVEQVGVPGTLLGSIPDTRLVDHPLHLSPGSSLVFYTDGVTEAGNPRGAFGLEGLRSVLEACAGLGAEETVERIDSAVTGLAEQLADDVALVVLRVRE